MTPKTRLRILFTASILLITGCQQQAQRPCPYAEDKTQGANAGCLVTRGDDVLIITMRLTGKQSLPGGTSDTGESPRCTAYRETYEETGVKVTVNNLLTQLDNGFQLYQCTPQEAEPVLETQDWKEVSDVSWRSWLSLDKDNWRFPEQFTQTRNIIRENISGISKQLE